ncbi:MAG: PAS domain-containing protein [Fibrella sp.]|nr:PAS domain-containing protein [Armatimonadota bacterium]
MRVTARLKRANCNPGRVHRKVKHSVPDDSVETVAFAGPESQPTVRDEIQHATFMTNARILADSEEQYRTLFDAIDVGFCIIKMLFDEQGRPQDYRFMASNPAFERHTGLVNALGKTARELVPNLDEFWFRTYGNVAGTGVPARFENHALAMGRWFEVHAVRIGEAKESKVGLLFTDITKRKETEGALQRSEERERARLKNIFMRAPAFMAALRGPSHTYELANLPYYQLIGRQDDFENQSIIGKTVVEVMPEMVEQGFMDLLDHVYRTGESYLGNDTRVVFQLEPDTLPDEHFVDFNLQPLLDEDGAVSGILVHGIDLTKRKRLEQERERFVDDLREASLRQRRFLKEMLSGFTEGRLRLCFTQSEMPSQLPPLSDPIELTVTSLRLLRKQLDAVAEGLRLPKERLSDFLTASHEAGMNAVRHANGGTARIHGDRDTGMIQVWISDNGPGIAEDMIHRAVEQGFTTGGFGQGFFYMQSCTDRLYLLSVANTGTTVVLEMDRTPPMPAWLNFDD